MNATAAGRSFRQIDGRSRALRTLLAIGIVADAINIVVTFLEIQALDRYRSGVGSLQEATEAIDRSRPVGIVVVVVYLSTVIMWLVWQHRAQSNLHALAVPRLTFSPGWAVGWWLIPIANLWKPFQTVRELWKASTGDEKWWAVPTSSVIGWWWACWVVFNFLYNTTIRFYGSESSTVRTYIVGDRVSIAGDLLSIVAAILAISIVRAVNERQAGLGKVLADRNAVPPRPDVPRGDDGQNP